MPNNKIVQILKNKYLILLYLTTVVMILMLFVDLRGVFSFKDKPVQNLAEINGAPFDFDNCYDCPSGYKDYGWPWIMRTTNISGQTGSLVADYYPVNIVLDFIIVYLFLLVIYSLARIIHLKSIKSITNKYAQSKNSKT